MPGRMIREEVRRRMEDARTMSRLRELRVAASKTRSKPNYWSTLEFTTRSCGGRQGLIDLARLCPDPRIRRMVRCWDRMGPNQRKYTRISHLCHACKIDEAEFFGKVVASLISRGVDVSPLIERLLKGLASHVAPAGSPAARTESEEPEQLAFPRVEVGNILDPHG